MNDSMTSDGITTDFDLESGRSRNTSSFLSSPRTFNEDSYGLYDSDDYPDSLDSRREETPNDYYGLDLFESLGHTERFVLEKGTPRAPAAPADVDCDAILPRCAIVRIRAVLTPFVVTSVLIVLVLLLSAASVYVLVVQVATGLHN